MVQIERGIFPHSPVVSNYQQDFAVQELPSTQKIQHVESVDVEEQGQPQRPYEREEKNVHEKARQQRAPNKAGGKKKYELCLRWRDLGFRCSYGYVIIPLVKCVLKYWQATAYWQGTPFVEEMSFR